MESGYTKEEMREDKKRLVNIFEEAQDQVSDCAVRAGEMQGPEAMAFQAICTKKLVPKAVGKEKVQRELSPEEIEKIKPVKEALA